MTDFPLKVDECTNLFQKTSAFIILCGASVGSERWLWMPFCTAKQLKYKNRRKVIMGWAAKGNFP